MKKVVKILLLVFCIFVVSCSKKENGKVAETKKEVLQSKTFVMNKNGIDINLTYSFVEDNIIKRESNNTISYMSLFVEDLNAAMKKLEPFSEQFKNIEGIEYSLEYKEDIAIEKMTIDFEKVDLEKIKDIAGINLPDNKSDFRSMEKTEKFLLDSGYIIK